MGIIKAGISAIRGAAADQWKEAFRAGEMGGELLMARGQKMTANSGSSDVITDGSVILVGEGECAIAVEGGKVIGIYDQPGENIFRSHESKGIFGGGLRAFAKDVGRRISFGGDVAVRQRIYYINTRELAGGTIRADGVPLRYRDPGKGIDMDGGVSCYGSYTFRITDPKLFYREAIRSEDGRSRRALLQQMDSEVLTALQPALAQLAKDGLHPNELLMSTEKLCEQLRQVMSDKWSGLRGIEVFSLALESVILLDKKQLNEMQQSSFYRDPKLAAGRMIDAASNALNLAADKAAVSALASAIMGKTDGWRCKCGAENTGKFCTECGAANHEQK